MMVNCLRPYMTVNLLGTKTLGKNVAMTRIDSPYGFVMYPVTSTVLNKEGQSDYASGFTPEYIISELNYYPWYELGDPNELLLKMHCNGWQAAYRRMRKTSTSPKNRKLRRVRLPSAYPANRHPVILPSSAKEARQPSCPNKILYIKKTER